MRIDPVTGLLDCARQLPSPNFDEREEDAEISLVVVHNISLPPGQFGGDWVEKFFTNQLPADADPYFRDIYQMTVSSHLYIRRDGEIIQFVPFNKRAWHAGASCYQQQQTCNDFSIGIELEGTDDQPYEEIQYRRLADIIACLEETYPAISRQRVTGHADIAPERKTDPGPTFDWGKLQALLDCDDFEKA